MGSKRKRSANEVANDNQQSNKRSKKQTSAQTNGSTAKTSTTLDKSPFVEQLTAEERKRELTLYEQLGSEDENKRIEAAGTIISALLGGDEDGEPVPETVLLRHLEKRLFRGLASGRNASRLGFSLVLTEVLGQLFGEKNLAAAKYPDLSFDKVLNILVEQTHAGGNVPGQEERDHYFGQLFGLECFVRSGTLFADQPRWFAVLDLVLKLSQKKSWLKSQCGFVVVQAVTGMDKRVAEKTLQKLADEGLAKTPEGVGIWLVALDRYSDMKVPSQPWAHPLAATSLAALPAILKDSGRDTSNDADASKKQKQSNWTAQLHFVWDLVLAHFIKLSSQDADHATEQFQQFWNRVVDEGFFSKNSSDNQKFSGFMIFQKMLEGTVKCSYLVKKLFSKNMMTCLMNQAAKEDRYLHRAALKALKAIEGAVEAQPAVLPDVLKQLLSNHGTYNFDQRTNTKTVEKLLQSARAQTIKRVLDILKLKDASKSGLEAPKYYQALGQYLFKLASIPSETSDEPATGPSVAGLAIQSLTALAFSTEAVPENIKGALRTKATSAFARLVKRPEDFGHLCNAVLSIRKAGELEKDQLLGPVLQQAFERLKQLITSQQGSEESKALQQALALLYAVGILQYYNEDPDVVDLFNELEECYDRLDGDNLEEAEGVSEFLVEILLAMVARPSSLMRQVSQQVFEAFTHLLSSQALELLTDPLTAEENARGQQALFSTEDEDMNDADAGDSEHSDEEELDSDVEIVDLEEAGSDEEGLGGDSDDDETSSDDDGEGKGKQNGKGDVEFEDPEALDKALADILGTHRLDKDAEAAESDQDSDMTDSEMMAFDDKLAEVFKQRAKASNKKKDQKDAKDTVVNFKHRVLDLLAIFMKREAPRVNPLCFDVTLPLLQLVRMTTTKPLANKASDIIAEFSKGLKKARSSNDNYVDEVCDKVDREDMLELLRTLHQQASEDPSHAFAKAASTASLAVVSILFVLAEKEKEKRERTGEEDEEDEKGIIESVFECYAETQRRWCLGEIKIPPSFFSDWLNWCQSHANNAAAAREKRKQLDEMDIDMEEEEEEKEVEKDEEESERKSVKETDKNPKTGIEKKKKKKAEKDTEREEKEILEEIKEVEAEKGKGKGKGKAKKKDKKKAK